MIQSATSSDKLGLAVPLSPSLSGDDHLAQQNNNTTSLSRDHSAREVMGFHSATQQPSRLSTPGPQPGMSPEVNLIHRSSTYTHEEAYETKYFPPVYYGHDASSYPALSGEPVRPVYTTPISSPSQLSDVVSLRNGSVSRASSMRPLTSKSRTEKTPSKKSRAKGGKRVPKIERPLSELAKSMNLPVIDIGTYVNRSAAERQAEVESSKTRKIKRPMNAFMLYRKAYQSHTKDVCEHNNHQLVSQVCGDSWPMESEQVRSQFTEWARLERENHAKTWPEYKFAPKKPKDLKRKASEEPEEAELEEYDHRSGRFIKRSRSTRTTTPIPIPIPEQEHVYAEHMPCYAPQCAPPVGMMIQGRGQMHMSSFEWSNPNKLMPAPYNQMSLQQPSQYYSSQAMPTRHQQLSNYPVEDVVAFHKAVSPETRYHSPQSSGMDSYGPPSQPRAFDQIQQQPGHIFNASFDQLLHPVVTDGSPFNPHNNSLLLDSHPLGSFDFDDGNGHSLVDGLIVRDSSGNLNGQEMNNILHGTGSGEWHIHGLSEEPSDGRFDADWSAQMDPLLSEETYTT